MGLTNHKPHQMPCEQHRELIELWSQALIWRELARKRLAEMEAIFDFFAMKIATTIGQTEYEQYHNKYLNTIQHGCLFCYPNK